MSLKYEPASQSLHISVNMQNQSVSFSRVQMQSWKQKSERESPHQGGEDAPLYKGTSVMAHNLSRNACQSRLTSMP